MKSNKIKDTNRKFEDYEIAEFRKLSGDNLDEQIGATLNVNYKRYLTELAIVVRYGCPEQLKASLKGAPTTLVNNTISWGLLRHLKLI
jgi:hypothetical protein